MALPVNRGGGSGKTSVWDIVQAILYERGEETTAKLHKAYKEKLMEIYAAEWSMFIDKNGKPYRNPYRVVNGQRVYFKKPPKGMTYLNFARYMNKWLNEGLVEKVAMIAETTLKQEQINAGLQLPVLYKLGSGSTYVPSVTVPKKAKQVPQKPPASEKKPPKKPVVEAKKKPQKVMLTEDDVRQLINEFQETFKRMPTKIEIQELISEEVHARATKADIDLLKEHLFEQMDEERKAASVRKLESALKELEPDLYEGIEDIESAIDDYRNADKADKEYAFEDILSAIENIEMVEE